MTAGRFAILAACLAIGGCAENLERRETVAFSSGNAVAANRVIQTIDPWPRASYLRGQSTDGEKSAQAIRRYRSGTEAAPASPLAPAPMIVPSVAPSAGNGGAPSAPAQ